MVLRINTLSYSPQKLLQGREFYNIIKCCSMRFQDFLETASHNLNFGNQIICLYI